MTQPLPNGLKWLIKSLRCFQVPVGTWGWGSDDPNMSTGEERIAAEPRQSHVVSSVNAHGMHAILLDIDREAYLIPSSSGVHSHLYVRLFCKEEDYFDFLRAAAKIGLIEQGYCDVSIKRGHTDLRLPWVKKGVEKTADEQGITAELGL